jgi:photosystem II stability/assembly factor-like uncharacterized protein
MMSLLSAVLPTAPARHRRGSGHRRFFQFCLGLLGLAAICGGATPAQAAWTIQTSTLPSVIIGTTSCSSATYCVQENNAGQFQYTTNGGTTWTASTANLTDSTWGMDCPSNTTCFATGDNGNIYKSTDHGATWATSSTGTPGLYGIACPSTTICYAVSGDGRVRKTTNGGSSWVLGTTQAPEPLYGISCPSTTVCYAVAAPGAVYKKQAASDTWDQVATNPAMPDILSPYTHSISCPSLTVCYTGGTGGIISKTTNSGGTWVQQTTAATPDIYALQCATVTRCIAVGVANNSSFTDDGGTTWTTETTGSAAAMYSVTWADGDTAIAGNATGKPYVYAAPPLPGGGGGGVTASVQLTAGTLSFINGTPNNVGFPTVLLNGNDQVSTQVQPFDVRDATGSGNGWAITATSTTFTSGLNSLSPTATSIVAAPTEACFALSDCEEPLNSVSYPYTLPAAAVAPAATKMYNAALETGMGTQTVAPTWSLKVPASTRAGAYSSTWTLTLTSGP